MSPEAITGCFQRRNPSLSFPRFQEKPFLIARSNTLTAMARIAKPSAKQVRHFGLLPGQVDNEQASAVQDLFRYLRELDLRFRQIGRLRLLGASVRRMCPGFREEASRPRALLALQEGVPL